MSDEGEKKPAGAEDEEEDEEDLEKLQAEIARMEAEAARITKETEELEKKKEAKIAATTGGASGDAAKAGEGVQKDGHSIYVGQVDYSATPEELLSHFEACGTVERVTIVCDKFSGRPKGFAYLEFQTEEAAENAVKLDGSEFKGRALKVTHKRVNIAGYNYQQQMEAGGGRGRGGGRGFRGGRPYRGGYRGGRGGRGFRGGGRGGGGYHPYY